MLEWRVERSLDERKGVVVVEVGLFASRHAFDAFDGSADHLAVAEFMSTVADWYVADYVE